MPVVAKQRDTLNILCCGCCRFGSHWPAQLKQLWVTLAAAPDNASVIVNFVLSRALEEANVSPNFRNQVPPSAAAAPCQYVDPGMCRKIYVPKFCSMRIGPFSTAIAWPRALKLQKGYAQFHSQLHLAPGLSQAVRCMWLYVV